MEQDNFSSKLESVFDALFIKLGNNNQLFCLCVAYLLNCDSFIIILSSNATNSLYNGFQLL